MMVIDELTLYGFRFRMTTCWLDIYERIYICSYKLAVYVYLDSIRVNFHHHLKYGWINDEKMKQNVIVANY